MRRTHISRLAVQGNRHTMILHDSIPCRVHHPKVRRCVNIAVICCLLVPVHRLLAVLFHTDTIAVALSQIILSVGFPFFGGLLIPVKCLLHILFYTKPQFIADTEIILRADMPLICSFRIPVNRLLIIGFHNILLKPIAIRDILLCVRVAPFCALLIPV